MAVTWSVDSLDSTKSQSGLSDVVNVIHWRATDSETVSGVVNYATRYGSVGLANPDSENFTEYAKITESNAVTWAKAALGSDFTTDVENNIAAELSTKKTPVTTSGVPW
jgi:hypothetical protein